jgi:hypothetical protein
MCTFKSVALARSDFEIRNRTYPLVSDEPLTVKEISAEVELKANADKVEFDSAKKKFALLSRVTLMFLASHVPAQASLPAHSAFNAKFPVAVGSHATEYAPSMSVVAEANGVHFSTPGIK